MRNRDLAAECFANRTPFKRSTGSVFTDGHTIWSYGHHFPMAFYQADGTLWINEDRYSMTTSHHQGALKRAIAEAGYAPTDATIEHAHGHANHFTFRMWSQGFPTPNA